MNRRGFIGSAIAAVGMSALPAIAKDDDPVAVTYTRYSTVPGESGEVRFFIHPLEREDVERLMIKAFRILKAGNLA